MTAESEPIHITGKLPILPFRADAPNPDATWHAFYGVTPPHSLEIQRTDLEMLDICFGYYVESIPDDRVIQIGRLGIGSNRHEAGQNALRLGGTLQRILGLPFGTVSCTVINEAVLAKIKNL